MSDTTTPPAAPPIPSADKTAADQVRNFLDQARKVANEALAVENGIESSWFVGLAKKFAPQGVSAIAGTVRSLFVFGVHVVDAVACVADWMDPTSSVAVSPAVLPMGVVLPAGTWITGLEQTAKVVVQKGAGDNGTNIKTVGVHSGASAQVLDTNGNPVTSNGNPVFHATMPITLKGPTPVAPASK